MQMYLVSGLIFSVLLGVSYARDDSSRDAYHEWAKKFSRPESDSGFIKWRQSLERIRELNDMGLSWTAGLTKFADMTPEEFKTTMLQKPQDVRALEKTREKKMMTGTKTVSNAESFDWRDKGAVTPVQDQGTVGTCWSFSTVANIEGITFLATNNSIKLSEEYLVDCDGGTADYDANRADCSVFGGWPYLAYQFLIEKGGIPSEEDVPYCAGTGDCYPCMKGPEKLCGPPPYYCDRDRTLKICEDPNLRFSAKIKDLKFIDSDEKAMTDVLQEVGPLSALLDATQLQYYKGGVWQGRQSPLQAVSYWHVPRTTSTMRWP